MLSNWAPDLSVVSATPLQRQLAYLEDVNSAYKFAYWWISLVPSRCTLSRNLELRLLDSSKIILLCGGTRLKYFTKNIHAIFFCSYSVAFSFVHFFICFQNMTFLYNIKIKVILLITILGWIIEPWPEFGVEPVLESVWDEFWRIGRLYWRCGRN